MDITTYDDLSQHVDAEEGILLMSMGDLRDVHGAGKLGSNVVAGIADKLASVGLGHSPASLPTSQWGRALIYRKGSPLARLIEAINEPSDKSIEVLKEVGTRSSEASDTLRRIRELVCD